MAVLGLDLGTSAVKALVVGAEGTTLGSGRASCAIEAPRFGWAEADPRGWLRAAAVAVRAACSAIEEPIEALGIAGQMHGVVLCAADGEPCRPALLWPDGRASAELSIWHALAPERRRALGNPLTPGMAGPLLAWVARHEPRVLRVARWALAPKDWLRLMLCGEAATEPSDASATLLWDLPADAWASDVVAVAGIDPATLAPVLASDAVAGTLTRGGAELLGLPAGVRVHVGAGDTAAALLAAGLRPGERLLNVGTGAQIAALSRNPETTNAPATHRYRAAGAGWYALAAAQNAGLALGWVLGALGIGWEQALREAFPCEGLELDGLLFVPHLSGERTPLLDPDARGAWVGLSVGHRRAHLLRAAWEGVAHAIQHARLALDAEAGPAQAGWMLLGGGGVQPPYRQLLADALGVELHLADGGDATARGAARLAGAPAAARGFEAVVAPAPREMERLARDFERWRRHVGALAVAHGAQSADRDARPTRSHYRELRPTERSPCVQL